MLANTRYFGKIEYIKEDILYFSEGLFGFENMKEYLLIHFQPDNDSLYCLQSLEEESLAFVVMNPFSIMPEYNPQPSEEELLALKLSETSPVTFYSLCVVRENLEESTINLKCPIAINSETRIGRQIILDDCNYSLKHPLKTSISNGKGGDSC